jgi:hypothetical protein
VCDPIALDAAAQMHTSYGVALNGILLVLYNHNRKSLLSHPLTYNVRSKGGIGYQRPEAFKAFKWRPFQTPARKPLSNWGQMRVDGPGAAKSRPHDRCPSFKAEKSNFPRASMVRPDPTNFEHDGGGAVKDRSHENFSGQESKPSPAEVRSTVTSSILQRRPGLNVGESSSNSSDPVPVDGVECVTRNMHGFSQISNKGPISLKGACF